MIPEEDETLPSQSEPVHSLLQSYLILIPAYKKGLRSPVETVTQEVTDVSSTPFTVT